MTRMGIDDAYYEGDHPLQFAAAAYKEAFGGLLGAVADNWMPIVVDAAVERLKVQGLRYGKGQSADQAAWDIWQANSLDAESRLLHTEAVKLGEAYLLVAPPTPGSSDPPLITAEDPSQMIVACARGNRRSRIAALKKWTGDDGYVYATLYLPDQILKWRSQRPAKQSAGRTVDWGPRPDDPGGRNPFGVVPVVPFRNNPSLRTGGRSDLTSVRSEQDAINKLLCDMLIGSEYQSFPQRVLLGVEVPKDPVTGQPIRAAELAASRSRLTVIEEENAKFGQWDAAALDNYINARAHLINGFTAKTRIPPYYVSGQIVNASGDSLTIADTNLSAKVRGGKMLPFGESYEDVSRLGFLAIGDTERANTVDVETIWADPEIRSQAQLADALVKLQTIGVPQEILWEKWGFSPVEITRMKAMREAERLLAPIPPPQNVT